MVTVYDKDGNPTRLDGCDARERVKAGLATYDAPDSENSDETESGEDSLKPVADMTVKEMKEELDAAGVKYKSNEAKYDLQQLVEGARAE